MHCGEEDYADVASDLHKRRQRCPLGTTGLTPVINVFAAEGDAVLAIGVYGRVWLVYLSSQIHVSEYGQIFRCCPHNGHDSSWRASVDCPVRCECELSGGRSLTIACGHRRQRPGISPSPLTFVGRPPFVPIFTPPGSARWEWKPAVQRCAALGLAPRPPGPQPPVPPSGLLAMSPFGTQEPS
ncbi:hypothetical protein OH76DRAFT_260336 [Lentinus brumalis]|uniref:Uncharacterized protein n=1 Tax=Lentinus brumalis TaxID=2498619 RepID=A0A371DGG8_9APHY|nr:hypothetical protein OH76DRAFT_260336 [Polyporus brumalis]